ncbi:MAG: hypothetical protein COS94_09690 [Candidatus Hydrogenedentes bacterium CG07_land_8_20_14_0_80_42_17]|nr:MAG: hypothetical protein AUJ18_07745 [Candidatus Hydrogenedentes bacterium CG1_02_42_14]PIU46605.1 MAG: hypothetical protein COS94_09690 [Candidatus Hydrogenedentes bacterium CG07_land_8_20_14_0_80_42_17]
MKNSNGRLAAIAKSFDRRFVEIDANIEDIKQDYFDFQKRTIEFQKQTMEFQKQTNKQFDFLIEKTSALGRTMKGLQKDSKNLLEYIEFVDQDIQNHKKSKKPHIYE